MNWKTTLIISIAILAVAAGTVVLIFSTEPEATRVSATKRTAMLVDVTTVDYGSFKPMIQAIGTVRAEKEIMLSPQVGGEIISVSPTFTPGGYVKKGETLLQIDRRDYETILLQRNSVLHQAEADLEMESGRQNVAEQDYALLGDQLSGENQSLVLRQPQLNSAVAKVESARAAVRKAELDLTRTSIEAPFNAHILERHVNLGSLVSPGQSIGRIVGLDEYWIEASVPISKLEWISFPEDNEPGASVRILNRSAWSPGQFREGKVHRLLGELEPQTRLARILVSVTDPLSRIDHNKGKPRLIVGSFVEVEIEGRQLDDVVRLDRDYLRSNDTVWVMNEGKLEIRRPAIAVLDQQYAYIREGLESGDAIITSNLSTVVEGASLRLGETEE